MHNVVPTSSDASRAASASERWSALIGWLVAEGRLDVVDAAGRLGVAPETVRRDLRALEAQSLLQRVHGGAVPMSTEPVAASSVVTTVGQDDATLIDQLWRCLPQEGTILLGTGTLTLALAHAILAAPPATSGLTVVTSSLDAALVLSRASRLSVYNVGGTVSPHTRAQEGDWALAELGRLHVEVSVVCPAGISLEHGLSQSTPAASAVSQAEVAAGARVIALTDAATLGRSAFVQFAELEAVEEIVVLGQPSHSLVQPFVDRGLSVTTGPAVP